MCFSVLFQFNFTICNGLKSQRWTNGKKKEHRLVWSCGPTFKPTTPSNINRLESNWTGSSRVAALLCWLAKFGQILHVECTLACFVMTLLSMHVLAVTALYTWSVFFVFSIPYPHFMSILRVMEFQLAFRNYYVSCWIPRTNIGEKFYMFSRFNAILATDRQTDRRTNY